MTITFTVDASGAAFDKNEPGGGMTEVARMFRLAAEWLEDDGVGSFNRKSFFDFNGNNCALLEKKAD